MRFFPLLIVLLLLLVGCSQPDPTPVPPGPPPSPFAVPTPIPTALPMASPVATLTPEPTSTPTLTPTPTPTRTPTPVPTAGPIVAPGLAILPTPALPSPTIAPPVDPLDEQLAGIGFKTSIARGLFAMAPLDRDFINREELTAFLVDELEEDAEEIYETQELYKTLGIIDEEVVLYDLLLGLYGESVLGFYDLEEERLYVVREAEEFSPLDVLTYSHEYTHGIQQQTFDLHSKRESIKGNSDQSLAYQALFEGDSTMSEMLYMITNMSSEDQAAARQARQEGASESFSSAPHVIQRTFVFPYGEGLQFVFQLYRIENSWDAINRAYSQVPLSTEQILHPEKYQAGEKPKIVELPELVGALGEGWTELTRDTFGEFFLLAYLETDVPAEQALAAASGWGGDQYALFKGPEDGNLLVSVTTWDTIDDALEFNSALMVFTESRTDWEWEAVGENGTEHIMELPDQSIYVSVSEADNLLIIATDRATLDSARAVLAVK